MVDAFARTLAACLHQRLSSSSRSVAPVMNRLFSGDSLSSYILARSLQAKHACARVGGASPDAVLGRSQKRVRFLGCGLERGRGPGCMSLHPRLDAQLHNTKNEKCTAWMHAHEESVCLWLEKSTAWMHGH